MAAAWHRRQRLPSGGRRAVAGTHEERQRLQPSWPDARDVERTPAAAADLRVGTVGDGDVGMGHCMRRVTGTAVATDTSIGPGIERRQVGPLRRRRSKHGDFRQTPNRTAMRQPRCRGCTARRSAEPGGRASTGRTPTDSSASR